MPQSVTYSFKDTSGAFAHPLTDPFQFAGQIGLHQFTVSMSTEKSAHDLASDGTVMVSAMAGNNGQLTIEMQQTSRLHRFLLAWYNTINIELEAGNAQDWATAAITLRNIVDGSQHVFQGVSPSKIPDKPYAAQGQRVTWVLMAADIQNITL